ncbi:magnesium transporter [human gut metagenome]|uniref:Magnesium transporter n=1 Tax=human gut metagenome TaxID=408170 RepID=K1RWH7_9ZZZZ
MTSDDNTLIKDIMETELISVSTHTDQEEVAGLFRKYDLLALPVLDTDNRLVGIVTVDDAMDVVIDEATEDIQKWLPLLQVRKHILKLLRLLTPKEESHGYLYLCFHQL